MKKFLTVCLIVTLAGVCFWQAGRLNGRILTLREEHHINTATPLANTPPLVAFTTVALGGFRGIIADWLWIRASRLQEEGRYFELVQLSTWITQLEPRFTEVWAFHAWNLAYNVSVLFESHADRWRWVRNGISLLRDQGILYNPGDPQIYRELGWIYQHKIGQNMDQANQYYREAWAEEMSRLFDGPGPNYDAYLVTPRTRRELLLDPEIASLAELLQTEGINPFSKTLLNPETLTSAHREQLASQAGQKLLQYIRFREMRNTYKLDPLIMLDIDTKYGALDWRLHQAHAVYWAYRGRQIVNEGYEAIANDRMIFQSLSDALRNGRAFIDPAVGLFVAAPNLQVLPGVRRAYEDAVRDHPDQQTVKEAHEAFLREAIVLLYTYRRMDDARALFEELSQRYPSGDTERGFDHLIYSSVVISLEEMSHRTIISLIEGSLYQAYFWKAAGEDDRAEGYANLAKLCWKRYMDNLGDSEELIERLGLPSLQEIGQPALKRVREVMKTPAYQEQLQGAERLMQ